MKILVALKQVPARDSQLRISADAKWIDSSDLQFEINEPDAFALEEALQLRDANGGEVVVLCAAPESAATTTIREALAKGADRAVHVVLEDAEAWDTLAVSKLLAAAARTESPDLLLTGLQSDDLGAGQTGVVMAELLRLPHATIIMQVAIADGHVQVKRELEDGMFQNLSMPLPALLTIQSGIKKLRYATLMGIKKARSKEVKALTPGELGVSQRSSAEVLRVYAPARSTGMTMLEGDTASVVAQLIHVLKTEAHVL